MALIGEDIVLADNSKPTIEINVSVDIIVWLKTIIHYGFSTAVKLFHSKRNVPYPSDG